MKVDRLIVRTIVFILVADVVFIGFNVLIALIRSSLDSPGKVYDPSIIHQLILVLDDNKMVVRAWFWVIGAVTAIVTYFYRRNN